MTGFNFLNHNLGAKTTYEDMFDQLKDTMQASPSLKNPNVGKLAVSTESLSHVEMSTIDTHVNSLQMALEGIVKNLGSDKKIDPSKITAAQFNAAKAAGLIGTNPKAFVSTGFKEIRPTGPFDRVVSSMALEDAMSTRIGLEAYDESNNRDGALYTLTYNFFSARQDEFSEMHFPTITVAPDNVGFGVTVTLMLIYDDLTRNISGDVAQYNKKNLIRAFANPTILKNESTRLIPVYRPQSATKFVDTTIIPNYNFDLEGQLIPTAPLKFGEEMDLMGICQPDELLAKGTKGIEDAIEPSVKLTNVYAKFGNDVLRIDVRNVPNNNFIAGPQGNYRQMFLNMSTDSVVLSKKTKQFDGSALTDLAAITTQSLGVRLAMVLTGEINIETGFFVVRSVKVSCHSVVDANGVKLDLTAGAGKALADILNAGELLGYDPFAYRKNNNKRQRGQLIDTTRYTQWYTVPLRAPVSAVHPVTTGDQVTNSDIQTLVTVTRVRTSAAAVTELLNTANTLNEYQDIRDVVGEGPDTLGVGRFFVRPIYFHEAIDMNLIVDSLTSSERPNDMQNALVNKIRDYAFRMFRDSEYKAAMEARGLQGVMPVVVVGTDPVIARYLQVSGDLRTLGGGLNCEVVSTLDYRVQGKIFLTLHIMDSTRNTEINPLNFGNMAWSPEVTMILPMTREGQISLENTVSPRFLHFVNCPILTVLEVSNLPDVLNKMPLYVDNKARP